jgi:CRP-like cAMP-binding protein
MYAVAQIIDRRPDIWSHMVNHILSRRAAKVAREPSAQDNRLLGALPDAVVARLRPDLEPIELVLGSVLYEPGSLLRHIYFPTTSIVSLLYVMNDGGSAEIAVVGNDGLVGMSLYLGGGTTPSRGVVQNAGLAYRIKVQPFLAEFQRHGELETLLLRYTQALLTQMVQTAACNRHHDIDQQFCRWLLLSLDRLPSNELTMTQELIGNMLGLSAADVSTRADSLQALGLLTHKGGQIRVIDRPGLERKSCECYRVVKAETDRLMPRTDPLSVGAYGP